MQYDVHLATASPDLAAIRAALAQSDPAAMTDFDRSTGLLRVSASLSTAELAELLARADQASVPAQIMALPSTCCGGCGG